MGSRTFQNELAEISLPRKPPGRTAPRLSRHSTSRNPVCSAPASFSPAPLTATQNSPLRCPSPLSLSLSRITRRRRLSRPRPLTGRHTNRSRNSTHQTTNQHTQHTRLTHTHSSHTQCSSQPGALRPPRYHDYRCGRDANPESFRSRVACWPARTIPLAALGISRPPHTSSLLNPHHTQTHSSTPHRYRVARERRRSY